MEVLYEMFYVYEYFNLETQEVFYVGKGTGKRYRQMTGRNEDFIKYIRENDCDVRIVKEFELEDDAFAYERELISFYQEKGVKLCNKDYGGLGGVSGVWTQEKREYQSLHNPMKDIEQRKRMHKHNPSFNPEVFVEKAKRNGTVFQFYDKTYYLVKDFAADWGISKNTAGKWIEKLDFIQNIIPTPVNKNGPFTDSEKTLIKSSLTTLAQKGVKRQGKKILLFGIEYESLSEAKDILGIASLETINSFKKDEEKILKLLPSIYQQKRLLTEEEKKIISNRNKNNQEQNKKAISIDGVIYSSAGDAEKILKINANTIRSRCKNKNFPTYYFLYDNQQPSQ